MPPFAQFEIHPQRPLRAERQHQPVATVAEVEVPAIIMQPWFPVFILAKLQAGRGLLQPFGQ